MDELEWARQRAERHGSSVSAVLTEAARTVRELELERERERQDAAWREIVEWATDGRGIPAAELEDARRELEDLCPA